MAKKAYVAKTPIEHDGKPYAEGETIELDDEIDAPALLAVDAIELAGKKAAAAGDQK